MTLQFEDLMRTADPARGFPDYTSDDRDRLLAPRSRSRPRSGRRVATPPTPAG